MKVVTEKIQGWTHSKENLCIGCCTYKEMRLRMEKKTSWNISHGKVRIHSKTFIPDSWDLSSSITRVEYLVFFPLTSQICWKDRKLLWRELFSGSAEHRSFPSVKWSRVERILQAGVNITMIHNLHKKGASMAGERQTTPTEDQKEEDFPSAYLSGRELIFMPLQFETNRFSSANSSFWLLIQAYVEISTVTHPLI